MTENMDDLPSLEALQNKINQAKPLEVQKRSDAGEYHRDISLAVRFLIELVAGIGMGAGFGYAIDQWCDSSPAALLVGLLLGLAAAIRNMMRSATLEDNTQVTKEKPLL